MCGLFGLYEFDQSSDLVSVQRCYNKTFQALSHRGPNNHGLENFRIRGKTVPIGVTVVRSYSSFNH